MAGSHILNHNCNRVQSLEVGRDLHRVEVKEMINIVEANCVYTDLCITKSIQIKWIHLDTHLYVQCLVTKIQLKWACERKWYKIYLGILKFLKKFI